MCVEIEELAEILGEEQEDFDFSLTTAPVAFFSMRKAERIFESLKADPSFAETLTAEQLVAAWDALPEDRKMTAADQLRTNPVVLRRMLMDAGARSSAISSIAGNLPKATIASTIGTLLEGHRGLEQSYARGVMLEGLQSRGLVADDAVGDPADLAGAWLAEYQAAT